MKGVILAGGCGTRLGKLTEVINKHLLPIYNKPMIFYPIETLVKAGIDEILIVISGKSCGDFVQILKNGEDFNLKSLIYKYQYKKNGGIADALSLAKDFVKDDNFAVILGDNTTDADITIDFANYNKLANNFSKPVAHVFIKEVPDPERFGVPTFGNKEIINIVEKPTVPDSNYAITGLYLYDRHVFSFIEQCSPSKRGELEITDVNNLYIKNGKLLFSELNGYWKDAGTPDSILESSIYYKNKSNV